MNNIKLDENSANSMFISSFIISLILAKDLTVEEQIILRKLSTNNWIKFNILCYFLLNF